MSCCRFGEYAGQSAGYKLDISSGAVCKVAEGAYCGLECGRLAAIKRGGVEVVPKVWALEKWLFSWVGGCHSGYSSTWWTRMGCKS